MGADDRAFADLAASVADGQPVDWDNVESGAAVPNRRLIRHLRLVESIAALYRSIPADPPLEEVPVGAPVGEPTGPRWGRLVLLERIGHGTSAEVFRAWDSELHREVALKLFNDGPGGASAGAHARVLQEARRLARVSHTHVVQVYGAEQHDGRVGLWMELVKGDSLERILAARGPFGASEAAIVGEDLCAALAAVHAAGLVHRDVKAQNVVRESGGRIVLMDFGTGEELGHDPRNARMAGTPLYLAPEIFRGHPATIPADLYSLGVLLFYLVTREFPVTAGSIDHLAWVHEQGRTRHLRDLRPDLPAAFVAVVERAIHPDAAKRYRSAGEMEAALRESRERFQPPAVVPAAAAVEAARRPAWTAGIAAALALAMIVGAIVWSKRGDRSAPPATPRIASVAVLPLADISGASSAPYLADALTDQLITTLGQVSALKVMSRTSVMPFKNQQQSTEAIANTLKVNAVLEGTVAVVERGGGEPGRVRVNARLIGAGGGILWSRTFERALGDMLALEAELARAIANGVHAAITPSEDRRLTQVASTNAAAERAYFQGLYNLNQLSAENMHAAIEAFRRAISLDPNHAAAHAGLARAHVTLGFMRATSHAEARASALAAASRAVALDADSSEAHEVLADLKFYYDWDWSEAQAAYQKAIDLNPSSARAHTQYARYLVARGESARALDEAERGAALDPLSSGAASTVALMHYYAHDYDRALAAALHALELDPRSSGVYFIVSRIHAARGAFAEAISANERAIDLAGHPPTGWRAHLVLLRAQSDRPSEARVALRDVTRQLEVQKERLGPGHLAYIQMALGDREGALQLLERAADDRDPDLLWLAVDPRADPLRKEARFQALLARLGVPLDPSVRLP